MLSGASIHRRHHQRTHDFYVPFFIQENAAGSDKDLSENAIISEPVLS